jgi:hypothetical protein
MAADEERHVFVFVNDKRDKTKQKKQINVKGWFPDCGLLKL